MNFIHLLTAFFPQVFTQSKHQVNLYELNAQLKCSGQYWLRRNQMQDSEAAAVGPKNNSVT